MAYKLHWNTDSKPQPTYRVTAESDPGGRVIAEVEVKVFTNNPASLFRTMMLGSRWRSSASALSRTAKSKKAGPITVRRGQPKLALHVIHFTVLVRGLWQLARPGATASATRTRMPLSDAEREALISKWIKPSSDSEQQRQERAERMIKDAIDAHSAFNSVTYSIYAKGSYANNTNVRLDSDVDVVVQCDDPCCYDYATSIQPRPSLAPPSYTGLWTPRNWRSEVVKALKNHFGASDVDASGKIAIAISEKIGSRPNADVVPSFDYWLFRSADRSVADRGSLVHATDNERIVNWPKQQLDNGRAKNTRTGQRYKRFARALKNGENALVEAGTISAKPSYLMECLMYNVADTTLQRGTLAGGFNASLVELWNGLTGVDHVKWLEPNELKPVFDATKKWTVQDARDVVQHTWLYLNK